MPEELELNIDQLPFSMEAEQSVLGAILVEPECIAKVLELLTPESFYRPQHRQLFSIMLAMFTSAQPIDFVTVLEKAKSERVFASDADAKVYLTQLVQVVPSAANVEAYAKLVQEKYYMRTLIGVAKSIISNSEKSDADARGLMEFAEQKLYEIRQGKDATGLVKVDRAIFELYDKLQRISGDDRNQYVGIPTGFSALDTITTGLNRTDLILLAARPAMGKSTFVMNIATNVAKQGRLLAGDEPRAADLPHAVGRRADSGFPAAHRKPERGRVDQGGGLGTEHCADADVHRRQRRHHRGRDEGQAQKGAQPGAGHHRLPAADVLGPPD